MFPDIFSTRKDLMDNVLLSYFPPCIHRYLKILLDFSRFVNGEQFFLGTGIYLLIFSTFLNIRVLSHFPVCIAARISTSSLIIAKLFLRQKGLKANFGDNPELLSPYTFLIRAFIQSYALYSFVSLVFLALFIGHESAWRLLLPCLPQAGVCSSL